MFQLNCWLALKTKRPCRRILGENTLAGDVEPQKSCLRFRDGKKGKLLKQGFVCSNNVTILTISEVSFLFLSYCFKKIILFRVAYKEVSYNTKHPVCSLDKSLLGRKDFNRILVENGGWRLWAGGKRGHSQPPGSPEEPKSS